MKKNESVYAALSRDQAPYFFHQGSSIRAYDYLGFHREGDRAVFRVWAPNAEYVSVIGDFNGWNRDAAPMTRVTVKGVWEIVCDAGSVKEGQNYKFFLRNGCRECEKADPYGRAAECPPKTASVICDIEGYAWRDAGWMQSRKGRFDRQNALSQPINIYELHAGSWKRHADGSYYTYTELAADLVTYVKQMGYTHVELMPIAEYPFDGSWGYQVCGYYAPTARYGTPSDLMRFVDTMHEAGIGVIFDWVPAHFPKDAHGLCEFDGQPLYEYARPDRMEHPSWGTRCFDLGREEVRSFLLSNAVFWADKYHVDGLRTDAVASMLYLDYDRKCGSWTPNRYGDNRDLDAMAFFRKLNRSLEREYPDVMMIAEESEARANLTHFENDGLGFTFKWNMGWMNDSLSYLTSDFGQRAENHRKLNFPITYAFDEHYILPISHDEVVHGKKSLLDRNPGSYEQKFAGTRAYLTYMMTHPGKKLLFMGCEIGQFREWDADGQIEWFLTDYDMHARLQLFVAELNHFYLSQPALWERDATPDGFVWIDPDNAANNLISYRRVAANGETLAVAVNFSAEEREVELRLPTGGRWTELLNSNACRYGGSCSGNGDVIATHSENGWGIRVRLSPLGAAVFGRKPDGE